MRWRYGDFNLKLSTSTLTSDVAAKLPSASGKLITEELASEVYVKSIPDSGASTFLYTTDGKLAAILATNGDSTTFSYDSSGRLTSSVAITGTVTVTRDFNYDVSGNLSTITVTS